jgi:hypothetical protein
VGPAGHAVVAYASATGVWAAARADSNSSFAAPEDIVPDTSSAPAAGVGPDATAYVLYSSSTGPVTDHHVGMVKLPAGGSWTSPTPVSALGYAEFEGGLAFHGAGAIAAWMLNEAATTNYLVQGTRWPAGAEAPEASRDLESFSTTGERRLQVFSDRAGSVLVTWGKDPELRAAAFDGGEPVLTGSTIPTGVIAGIPAILSATFADSWSAVGEPTWDFGDGTAAASGGTVQHSFPAAGDYTVTASAVDGLGNRGTATFAVSVGECEGLAGIEALRCRCGNGLGIAACDATLPTALTNRFEAACTALDAAEGRGPGRKGRKAASRALKGFKKARRALNSRAGRRLPAGCRAALVDVLAAARANGAAFKDTL